MEKFDAPFDESAMARLLAGARNGAAVVSHALIACGNPASAFRVQDATLALIGPVAGWKVGAKGPALEPSCAPLPAGGITRSGAALVDGPWRLRGIEVEVALRLGHDLVPDSPHIGTDELQAAVEAIVPAIEVVETRLRDWRESDPLAQLRPARHAAARGRRGHHGFVHRIVVGAGRRACAGPDRGHWQRWGELPSKVQHYSGLSYQVSGYSGLP